MQTNRLLTEPVSKIFFRYLMPAIMANMVTSIYILADTIIIGKVRIWASVPLGEVVTLFIAIYFMKKNTKEARA